MKRERGFYWVRPGKEWGIAYWSNVDWWVVGVDAEFHDKDFLEIDENRITRQKPNNETIPQEEKDPDWMEHGLGNKLFGLL